jgi:hypothetical protein
MDDAQFETLADSIVDTVTDELVAMDVFAAGDADRTAAVF